MLYNYNGIYSILEEDLIRSKGLVAKKKKEKEKINMFGTFQHQTETLTCHQWLIRLLTLVL